MNFLLPINEDQHASSPVRVLGRHVAEGMWRIVSNVDGLLNLDDGSWEGLVSLRNWFAKRGCVLKPILSQAGTSGLVEDDPTLQTYRSLRLLMNLTDLDPKLPCAVLQSARLLVAAGDTRNCPHLSIAALVLLLAFHEKKTVDRTQSWPCVLFIAIPFLP